MARMLELFGPCVEWPKYCDERGYGRQWQNGKTRYAHVIAYEDYVGPVTAGLELDHICRNPSCCNPDHLEEVTHQENVNRSPIHFVPRNEGKHQAAKTHCPQGHPYDDENTYHNPQGRRECRECGRAAVRKYRAKQ